jgi:hypothetical protein
MEIFLFIEISAKLTNKAKRVNSLLKVSAPYVTMTSIALIPSI